MGDGREGFVRFTFANNTPHRNPNAFFMLSALTFPLSAAFSLTLSNPAKQVSCILSTSDAQTDPVACPGDNRIHNR